MEKSASYVKEKSVFWLARLRFYFFNLSITRQISLVLGLLAMGVISLFWFWLGGGSSVALDSENKVIVEEVNNSGGNILNKISLPESPVASALVFVDGLGSTIASAFKGSSYASDVTGGPIEDSSDPTRLATAAGNAVVAQTPVLTIVPASTRASASDNSSILTYEIETGDSLESIAQDFGVSVQTLMAANNISPGTKLKPGDKISVLPVDGVKHIVKNGDTIASIAKRYNADADRIIAFNDLADNAHIKPGDVLVIPGGEYHDPINPKYAPENTIPYSELPNLTGYYGLPSGGRITYGLHKFNAVDIGGRDWCNTPVYAAAGGIIITADGVGWNGGYGKYIKIAHDNGTITLYAHASQLLVDLGQSVAKGQTIALMGSTGHATGCHVHFEIRGARNPLANY